MRPNHRAHAGLLSAAAIAILIASTVAAGCGDDDDDVRLEPSGSGAATGGPAHEVTFYREVAPILYEHCIGCHVEGGIGGFALIEYESALPYAALIADKTATREMPPWPADNSGECNTWRDARWLDQKDIDTLGAWAAAGAPAGDPADAPAVPAPESGLTNVGATVGMAVPYLPDQDLEDDYRCFVVDPGLTENQYLTGFQVRPGDPRVVHHVILFALDTAEQDLQALNKDGGDGYPCIGGAGVEGARFVVGWAPGTPVTLYPEGTGLPLAAGRKMILQVHYNLAQGAFPDRTEIDMRLASSVAKPARIERIATNSMELPPGMEDVAVTASLQVPTSRTLYGVAPHMHTLGTSHYVEKRAADGTSCVVNVPHWDFHWQQLYLYEQPLSLAAGDVLELTCRYDTRGKTTTVTQGEGTDDEMCLTLLYVTEEGGSSCAPCGGFLDGTASPNELCADAKALLGAVQQCACGSACETACAEACSTQKLDAGCAACAEEQCESELAACKGDR